MPHTNDLIPILTSLPRHEYANLIREVDAQRRRVVEQQAQQDRPRNEMSKDEFVDWIARQHFAVDKGITRIVYFPRGAPAEEVRLLEVNALANLPENEPVEAFDFMPDIEGVHYSLFVADVPPNQFEAIRNRQLGLPQGWQWGDEREIPAGGR